MFFSQGAHRRTRRAWTRRGRAHGGRAAEPLLCARGPGWHVCVREIQMEGLHIVLTNGAVTRRRGHSRLGQVRGTSTSTSYETDEWLEHFFVKRQNHGLL
jgi:hypothetical protein